MEREGALEDRNQRREAFAGTVCGMLVCVSGSPRSRGMPGPPSLVTHSLFNSPVL